MIATDLVAGYDLHTDADELGRAAAAEVAADSFTPSTWYVFCTDCCVRPSEA
ncbi:LxmA leader domain family RiPP [Actinoallomurus rhizosphaericola]|uniref:LxmA leader domain family RiPP n=1 Tax=Actinoallomurus rhizosphaericola TaxID=2952536 RepID=UPI002091ED86|nr:LxmA leader domain family RiPP [Actinoallomurus rhizosphaericola]MCO5997875.1 LxmA leader domain family RiPP [Actinoallomurus rhizosphaericola]